MMLKIENFKGKYHCQKLEKLLLLTKIVDFKLLTAQFYWRSTNWQTPQVWP